MRLHLARRIEALEAKAGIGGPPPIRLIFVHLVDPRDPDRLPDGIRPCPPWLPAVDRLPEESVDAFMHRLGDMLPAEAPIVSVVSR
jgi:hypothetical protein